MTEPTAAGGTPRRNYGDPAAEYAAARGSAALAERPERRFLRVHGRDPVRMVQGLVSNDVTAAGEERAVYATVLTPKGKMVADVRVLRRGEELLLETDAGALDGLVAHLRKFVPPLFARFDAADGAWTALTLLGPDAPRLAREVLGAAVHAADGADTVRAGRVGEEPVVLVATSHAAVPGYDILCAPDVAAAVRDALAGAGARPIGAATLDVLRIEAGTPAWGRELDENTIPLEAGLRQRAISETKGCYTGQEVIIRILHRGHVNWLLRGLLLGDAPTPERGAELHNDDGRKVARVTSAAWSPAQGQAIALAYVRREVAPGTALTLQSGARAEVVELPFPTA
jgi:tRNA-modifying protein YgfZ